MVRQSHRVRVLAVPNLQGERWFSGLGGCHVDWVPSTTRLSCQVDAIVEAYDGHNLLLGSSFGGLASWRFVAEKRSPELRGIVLVDVLPKIELFPRRKAAVFAVLAKLPSQMAQVIYDVYRARSGQESADIIAVLERVQSIQNEFPRPCFSLPTMVVSSNHIFHQSWIEMARMHQHLSVTEKRNISGQVIEWIDGLDLK